MNRGLGRGGPPRWREPGGGAPGGSRFGGRREPSEPPARGVCPIYQQAQARTRLPGSEWSASTNPGLLHDRYADVWVGPPCWPRPSAQGRQQSPGQRFLQDVASHVGRVGPAVRPLLDSLHQRRARLWQRPPGVVLELQLATPLVSGLGLSHPLESGFVWDRNLGVPYLPGSSLKGAARAWAEQWAGLPATDARRIFGELDTDGAGSVIFHALYPLQPVALRVDVLNPHFGESRGGEPPGDWLAPVPVFFLTVPPRTRFRTAVQARRLAGEEDAACAARCLVEALTTLGSGAKTAVGYGLFAAT